MTTVYIAVESVKGDRFHQGHHAFLGIYNNLQDAKDDYDAVYLPKKGFTPVKYKRDDDASEFGTGETWVGKAGKRRYYIEAYDA